MYLFHITLINIVQIALLIHKVTLYTHLPEICEDHSLGFFNVAIGTYMFMCINLQNIKLKKKT